MLKRWLAALVVASLPAIAHAEVPVPALKARVTDLTGTLSPGQAASLEQKLAAFETRKGSQMAVLMLPTTQPETVEQFSIRVAEAWKIGRKGTDDGVILVVAKDDRRLRIEVGYGLEGAIPDATAKRVISEVITPRFKAGDFAGGISAGTDQLIRLVDGEKLPPPSGKPSGTRSTEGFAEVFPWYVTLFLIVCAGAALTTLLGRFPAALLVGIVGGVGGYLVYSLGIGILIAVVASILTFLSNASRGLRSGPGWTVGGGGSSGGGSSGWSGGGGGSFGGGGSSGSW